MRATYKLKKSLGIQLRRYIFTNCPSKAITPLVGISREGFREYLRLHFTADMRWDNYGEAWELDHIAPLELFDLTYTPHLALAFHYLNTRPLAPKDNLFKSASLREAKHDIESRLVWLPDSLILKELLSRIDATLPPSPDYSFLKSLH